MSRRKIWRKKETTSVAPIKQLEEQVLIIDPLSLSCKGRNKTEGGLTTDELEVIAKTRGISNADKMYRMELLEKLCDIQFKETELNQATTVKHLPYDLFTERFPLRDRLGKGAYGNVYNTTDDMVIKELEFSEAIKELNICNRIYHTCIIRPLFWSHKFVSDGNYVAYLVMPKGIPIEQAYREKLITINDIISDTLSAIAYMNAFGYAHADIKPANMVYHGGFAKIIDMGFARNTVLFNDGVQRITDVAYTQYCRDPEYVFELWNNINAETYALVKSYYMIIGHTWRDATSRAYTFSVDEPLIDGYPPIEPSVKTLLEWIFNEGRKKSAERLSTIELLDKCPPELITQYHYGSEIDTRIMKIKQHCRANNTKEINAQMIMDLGQWIANVAINLELSARNLFNALHLLNRTVNIVPSIEVELPLDGKLKTFGIVCLYLSCITFGEEQSIKRLTKQCAGKCSINLFNYIVIEVLKETHCIISGITPWDYASCADDLVDMLNDILSCDYDPFNVKTLNFTNNTKLIDAAELMMLWKRKYSIQDIELLATKKINNDHRGTITAVTTESLKPITLRIIRYTWKEYLSSEFNEDPELFINLEYFSVLLVGKHLLVGLNVDEAIKIYRYLRRFKGIYVDVIKELLVDGIDTNYLRSNPINPFTLLR